MHNDRAIRERLDVEVLPTEEHQRSPHRMHIQHGRVGDLLISDRGLMLPKQSQSRRVNRVDVRVPEIRHVSHATCLPGRAVNYRPGVVGCPQCPFIDRSWVRALAVCRTNQPQWVVGGCRLRGTLRRRIRGLTGALFRRLSGPPWWTCRQGDARSQFRTCRRAKNGLMSSWPVGRSCGSHHRRRSGTTQRGARSRFWWLMSLRSFRGRPRLGRRRKLGTPRRLWVSLRGRWLRWVGGSSN
jgi:hypothetical protein